VELLVAVKQREAWVIKAWVIGDKVHFRFLIAAEHYDIFHDSGRGFSGYVRQFKAVPVQMNWMYVITRIAHLDAVTPALFQVK
jgi:hypothetical protein